MSLRRVMILGLIVVGMTVGVAGPALADGHGTGACGAQEACLYINLDYNGTTDARVLHFGLNYPGVGNTVDLHHDINPGFGDVTSSAVNKLDNQRVMMWENVDSSGQGYGANYCLDHQAGVNKDPDFRFDSPISGFNDQASAFEIQGPDNC